MTYDVFNPESMGRPSGWNNGMLAPKNGRLLFVAGQTGRDESGKVTTDDFVEQFRLVLKNIVTVVKEAGGKPEDIGRFTIFVTDKQKYLSSLKPLGEAYRSVMGKHYCAMALLEVKGLVDPGALMEVEATAVIPE
jgi:enamine deaminase RidA (YjgF/YER057c/UK114 family)